MRISRRLWTLLGLLLVPLVVAGGFLWATWDFDSRLERVEAAVVNLDEPVRLNDQLVPLGRQLAGELVEGAEEENFRWTLTDNEDAADGLAAGRYAAVVTIPADFSAQATSWSENKADEAERATIEVQTSEVSGIADPVVGRAVTAAATRALNTELTEQYLDGIYLGFNQLNKQFGTLADGAEKLADGAGDLSGGLSQTATGGRELAGGLDQLDRGADQLATGTRDLATGAGQLSTGLGQLSSGVTRTANGADDLADGTADLATGADRLADGAGDLSSGVRRLDRGAEQLADGADDLAGGIGALRNGTAAQPGGTKAYAAGVRQFAGGLQQYSKGLQADPTAAQIEQLCSSPQLQPICADPVSRQVLVAGFTAGLQGAAAGLEDRGNQPGLLSSADRLADGAAGIDTGVRRLQTGATTYATGVETFADGVGRLATGSGTLARGTRDLANGADRLATGTDGLADGLGQLATGARQSATGSRELATGAGQLSTGASQLATGTGQSAQGAGQLADGLTELSTGSKGLADGTREFADGIAEGRKEVPTYTENERERLSGVVSAPVTVPASDGASYSDIATSTLLVVLALWLGGLAAFVVLRPVTGRVLSSMKPSWRLAFEALGPAALIGAVQAVVLSVVLQQLLDLSAGQTAALVPFAVLTAVTFAAVNQALVAALGGLGRFLSVLAAVIVTAGALTAAAPALFGAIAPYLPLTPALQGVRALASEGGGVGPAVGVLVGWLLLGVSVSVLAVARRRMLPAGTVGRPVAVGSS
jgi:putative membrane protein